MNNGILSLKNRWTSPCAKNWGKENEIKISEIYILNIYYRQNELHI